MSNLTRKFVAVLMLLWLPLSGASALAATISMQTPQHGSCHAAATPETYHAEAGEHQHHHDEVSSAQDHSASDEQGSSGNSCSVCHLACSGYLAVPAVGAPAVQAAAPSATPYAVSFRSITSAPLLPPPLVRA
jgi:hypothetical protein